MVVWNGIDLSGIGTWVVKDRFAHVEPTDKTHPIDDRKG
jgi:hypothetical protein